MKRKFLILSVLTAVTVTFGTCAFAYDTSEDTLYKNAQTFASRYEYHEGDFEKSISLYPDVPYMSGPEIANDGKEYEFPIFYYDKHAGFIGDYDLQKGEMNLSINGQQSEYSSQCVLYNGVTLLPASVFKDLECMTDFDETLYVTTISKADTTLEIIPKLRAMRKNKENGFYVPLEAVARFVDDVVYVPVRAVADELNINVDWDGITHTVILSDM